MLSLKLQTLLALSLSSCALRAEVEVVRDADIGKTVVINYSGKSTEQKNLNLINAVQSSAAKGAKDILINIEWGGGEWISAVNAYWAIRSLKANVRTYAAGRVLSSAIVLYCAGSERYASDTAIFQIHPLSLSNQEFTMENLEERQSLLKAYEAGRELIYGHCFSNAEWRSLNTDRPQSYFGKNRAVALGLVNRAASLKFLPILVEPYSQNQFSIQTLFGE